MYDSLIGFVLTEGARGWAPTQTDLDLRQVSFSIFSALSSLYVHESGAIGQGHPSLPCSNFIENLSKYPLMINAGQLKREDSARAWLNCLVLDLVQCVQLISQCHGIKRVFFCGGFCSTPLVRSIITTEFVRRKLSLLSLGWVGNSSCVLRYLLYISCYINSQC